MENITTTVHTHPTYILLHLNYEKMKVTLVLRICFLRLCIYKERHSHSCVEGRFVMSMSIFII